MKGKTMGVNVSFICRHCGGHIRKGNHAKCKRILRRQREEELQAKVDTEAAKQAAKRKGCIPDGT